MERLRKCISYQKEELKRHLQSVKSLLLHYQCRLDSPVIIPLTGLLLKNKRRTIKAKGRAMTSAEEDKLLQDMVKISEKHEEDDLFEQKVSISDQEHQIINNALKDIIRVFKPKPEPTPKLDKVIDQALVGDTWYNPPRFVDNNHPVEMVPAKALPNSSKVKLQNRQKPKLQINTRMNACEREILLAQRSAKNKGKTFTVNLERFGWVTHTPTAPVWEIPGFCYLAAIHVAMDLPAGQFWRANPTVNELSHIDYKYRKLQPFFLVQQVKNQHYTVIMKEQSKYADMPLDEYRDISGWDTVDTFAKGPNKLMTVGGDDKADIKHLDGYQLPTMGSKNDSPLNVQRTLENT